MTNVRVDLEENKAWVSCGPEVSAQQVVAAIEANGKTILENTLITISTESGDGRHNDVKRELSGVFHAITGANGRFKTGQIMDIGAEGIDVYNTMLDAMGAKERLGPSHRERNTVDTIRV